MKISRSILRESEIWNGLGSEGWNSRRILSIAWSMGWAQSFSDFGRSSHWIISTTAAFNSARGRGYEDS